MMLIPKHGKSTTKSTMSTMDNILKDKVTKNSLLGLFHFLYVDQTWTRISYASI